MMQEGASRCNVARFSGPGHVPFQTPCVLASARSRCGTAFMHACWALGPFIDGEKHRVDALKKNTGYWMHKNPIYRSPERGGGTPKLRLGAHSGTRAHLASVPKPGRTAGPVASGDRTMRLTSGRFWSIRSESFKRHLSIHPS